MLYARARAAVMAPLCCFDMRMSAQRVYEVLRY